MNGKSLKSMYALVDCNNFYCSCERLFNPALKNKPIVVLSNNDGCIISRSAEAKALGLKMTTPIHHVKTVVENHHVHVFSSNYTLYQDMSDRVMETLKTLSPAVETYSIDEAFVDLSDLAFVSTLEDYGRTIKERIRRWVGVPVCVGIGPNKTLAKLANHAAKKYPAAAGVVELSSADRVDRLLALTDVQELWGVGAKQARKLNELGIFTALELKNASAKRIRKHFSVIMERTLSELNGELCLPLELETTPRKHILCSRAFGVKQYDQNQVQAALAFHVQRAANKLRKDQSLAGEIKVSIKTNPYAVADPQYASKQSHCLAKPTDDSSVLLHHANELLQQIWRPNFPYHKVGVVLSDLRPKSQEQLDLINAQNDSKQQRLMQLIDRLNADNNNQVNFAASMKTDPNWAMRREHLSRAYTTRWSELIVAH